MMDSKEIAILNKAHTLAPPKAANRLIRVAEAFSVAHDMDRFPVNIDQLALGSAEIFGWNDPIIKIQPAAIKHFEGALFPNDDKSKWLLLFNQNVQSQGRIRFTKAHELGHYILHRKIKEEFQCSSDDMLNWSDDERNIEAQADLFASYLLMPLDDFRKQIGANISIDVFSHCADRYGVSITASILKWLSYTQEKAILIMSNDGFINWAWSSKSAFRSGAFFKTRKNTIPVPLGSIAANDSVTNQRQGANVACKLWFKHADEDCELREMKISADQYDSVLTLLVLPKFSEYWQARY